LCARPAIALGAAGAAAIALALAGCGIVRPSHGPTTPPQVVVSDATDSTPSESATKENVDVTYVWTEDERYGLGFYVGSYMIRTEYEDYDHYRRSDEQPEWPAIVIWVTSVDTSLGDTPEEIAEYFTANVPWIATEVSTIDIPNAVQAVRLAGPGRGALSPSIMYYIQKSDNSMVSMTMNGWGDTTLDDLLPADEALNLCVLP